MSETSDNDRFATTQWSVVLRAREAGSPESEAALEILCGTYWRPLFVFARRKGKSEDEAKDLVQGFMLFLLEKSVFQVADPERGRFRSFLRKCFERFILTDWARAHALKREPRKGFVAIEAMTAEERSELEKASIGSSPSTVFDRQWAADLLSEAIRKLRVSYESKGKGEIFKELKRLLDQGEDSERYATVAARLGMRPNAISVRLLRLRRELGATLRAEVEQTVESREDADGELAYLMEVLALG